MPVTVASHSLIRVRWHVKHRNNSTLATAMARILVSVCILLSIWDITAAAAPVATSASAESPTAESPSVEGPGQEYGYNLPKTAILGLRNLAPVLGQCGGTGLPCTGPGCLDIQWASCPPTVSCYRISEFYRICDRGPPLLTAAPPLPENAFTQCGGSGGTCAGPDCADVAWPDFTCPMGFTCVRKSSYYWQCDTRPVVPPPPAPPGAFVQCGGGGGTCLLQKPPVCKDLVWPGALCPQGYSCERVSQFYWQCNNLAITPAPEM